MVEAGRLPWEEAEALEVGEEQSLQASAEAVGYPLAELGSGGVTPCCPSRTTVEGVPLCRTR